jgi:hypothetical protein
MKQTMSLRMPSYLNKALQDICDDEKISKNQFILSALSEKIASLQTVDIIEKRAKKASKKSFMEALKSIPSNEPKTDDKL